MKKINFLKRLLWRHQKALPVVATPYNQALKRTQRQYFWALGLVFVGLAYYSYHYSQQRLEREKLVPVVVAATGAPLGKKLASTDLSLREWPQSQIPVGYFAEKKNLVGQTLIQHVAANEAVVRLDVSVDQDPDSITAQFNAGQAFALGEDWLVSKLPPLGAGDRVDVLATNPKATDNLTTIVASNLEVIAVPSHNGRKNLVLSVTATEAEALLSSRGLRLPMQVLVHNRNNSSSFNHDENH